MKMTKIESARIVYEKKGHCFKVTSCFGCFNEKWCESKGCYQSDKYLSEKVALAEAYIKRHESKSKKKVEEPKPIKTVGIDNSDVTLALTAQREPTPLQIAKMIRDNGYSCINLSEKDVVGCKINCPMRLLCREYKHNSNNNLSDYIFKVKKQLIDDYISANEPVKDCPANSEIPDPIRVDIPDIFYCPTPHGILRFKRSQIILKDTNNEDCLLKLHDEYPCYRTLEEAVIVAKKLWNGEGK